MNIRVLIHHNDMRPYLEQVWQLLKASYADVTGGLHFASRQQLLDTTVRWKLVFQNHQLLAVTVFKAKKGLKLVAMGINQDLQSLGKKALIRSIKQDLACCWMELSEKAERFVLKYCDGHKYIIHSSLVAQLLDKKVEAHYGDSYHYHRSINQLKKMKIALGTPQLNLCSGG
ncbi:hypothetical protein [uncultured Shewanella sp.]|uniref:hypothetical protein n=1 Tax=uncultured Shewanella sp. TaxID=173975 RepID=UPI002601FD7E|nr:hypothetical protein [uncultured Shewanella sp.]